MFNFFKKNRQNSEKLDLEGLIKKDGIDFASMRFAEIVARKIPNRAVAQQFILEELDAARQGNVDAQDFIINSGISPDQYIDAMQNSTPEVDGPDGPQQLLLGLCMGLSHNPDLMTKFKVKVAENIMQQFSIGKFSGDSGFWVDELIAWAEEFNLPELQAYDTPAYRQTGFPRDARKIMSLQYLHLPSCGISNLPSTIGRLNHLRAICLDNNQISDIPSDLCNLKNLDRLDLDDNLISSLPREIGKLGNLQILSLRNNPIEDLPIEMLNLRNLRKLDLIGVRIHFSSIYSPLSPDGFRVYQHFHEIIKEDNLSNWLANTDTSNLEITDTSKSSNVNDSKLSFTAQIRGGGETEIPAGVDRKVAEEFFPWAEEEFIFSLLKYKTIIVDDGLNAISSDNEHVSMRIELQADKPAVEAEMLQAFREHYIKACQENSLTPNKELRILTLSKGGERIDVSMWDGNL